MHGEKLSFLNANYYYGCHPLNLRSFFECRPFCKNLYSKFPLNIPPPDITVPELSVRRRTLDSILNRSYKSDLPGNQYFELYIRHKYRLNCSVSTLRLTETSLIQFLSFYRDGGKSHLEQITREDIESFVEYQQDRGLKPNSVRTRLCAVYAFVHFLIEKKVVSYELLERRIKLKLPDRLPRAIDPEDLKQLLAVIDHVRNICLFV